MLPDDNNSRRGVPDNCFVHPQRDKGFLLSARHQGGDAVPSKSCKVEHQLFAGKFMSFNLVQKGYRLELPVGLVEMS